MGEEKETTLYCAHSCTCDCHLGVKINNHHDCYCRQCVFCKRIIKGRLFEKHLKDCHDLKIKELPSGLELLKDKTINEMRVVDGELSILFKDDSVLKIEILQRGTPFNVKLDDDFLYLR